MQIPVREQRLLRAYKKLVRRALGTRLATYRLFGSWARGEATPESDVDVLVVVRDLHRDEKNRLLDLAYDLSLTAERYLSPLIVDRRWYTDLVASERRLARDIEREGIDL